MIGQKNMNEDLSLLSPVWTHLTHIQPERAEGRVEPGVFPPEACLDPEPFFKELEEWEIFYTGNCYQ
jgi:hypothetical protein